MQLQEKVAVVTGAASGIGLATSSLFAELGATVVGVDADEARLPALAALGPNIHTVHADITDPGAPDEVMARAESLNGPDVLVNNAGIMHSADLRDLTRADWDQVFSVNVRAMFFFCQAALRTMLTRKSGAIVNVSSVMALRAEPGSAAYSASKSAVLALTRDIAVSYATLGIRCNAVCPGWVDTPMNAQYVLDVGVDEAGARVALQQPLGRMLRPEEVANVIAFLCSPDASGMTGAYVPVDGGMSAYYST
jgi:meso-butanediol dehydrogenase / (S,S)-butanediol dehydrogenase / diacetyl reductase